MAEREIIYFTSKHHGFQLYDWGIVCGEPVTKKPPAIIHCECVMCLSATAFEHPALSLEEGVYHCQDCKQQVPTIVIESYCEIKERYLQAIQDDLPKL